MNPCPHCGKDVAPDSPNCPHCGKGTSRDSLHDDATLRYEGPPLGLRGQTRRTTPLDTLFKDKVLLLIGRAADCDVCLSHPMVSRHHALLERRADGRLRLTDLDSVNGISVNGQRITVPVFLDAKAAVGIGPFLFTTSAGNLCTVDGSRSLRLEARHLDKVVTIKAGEKRKLLDDINIVVEPGEFVSLLGPSGSGKTTLMDCLNGRRWATGGKVLANGEDFYRYFDNFRQSLGYVPQKDIVHTQLSVFRALYYTARLRLPPDTSNNELTARIEEVIKVMELGPHRETLIANLSGGQIKRVSLGAELLARPCLLYIDEATSGLDAGTEARMMRLFRQLADEGKSLICITHNVDNIDRCHLALILARGKMIYYGPPADAPRYFGVARISDIYDQINSRDLAEWEQQFRSSEYHQEFVLKRLALSEKSTSGDSSASRIAAPAQVSSGSLSSVVLPPPAQSPVTIRPKRPPLWHQFRILTRRYAELMWGDGRSLRLLLLQAPVVAIIVLVGFANQPFEGKIPLLRHLTEREKNVLLVLKGIEQDLVVEDKKTEEKVATVDPEIIFFLEKTGTKQAVKVSQIKELLEQLEKAPPDSLQRKALEEVHIEIVSGDSKMPVNLKQVRELQDLLRQSQLSTKLLYADKNMSVVPESEILDPTYTYMLLFMNVIIVLWFGCNNAAKEIVKEEAIYGRERAINLGILPYLSSKFLLLGLVTILQALLLILILYGTLEGLHAIDSRNQVPPRVYSLGYVEQFGVLALLSLTAVALGLLLSACVSSPDRANSLLPYVLIPQIILGGCILPIAEGSAMYWLAALLSPVYWAFRAIRQGAHDLPNYTGYQTEYMDDPWMACGRLAIQLVVMLGLTTWFLRRKDVRGS